MVTRKQTKIGSSRKTKNFTRTRKAAPGQFSRFFTKKVKGGKRVVIGVKPGGKTKVQAVLKPKKGRKKK